MSSGADSDSASVQTVKRAGSSDSDDSFLSKNSHSVPLTLEEHELEPYVRRRKAENDKTKMRLAKMAPEEQDRHRQTINSRERKRMHGLNSEYDRLRSVLPHNRSPNCRKLSKIGTLAAASDHIVHIVRENEQLRQRLFELGALPNPSASIDLLTPPSSSSAATPTPHVPLPAQQPQQHQQKHPKPSQPLPPPPQPLHRPTPMPLPMSMMDRNAQLAFMAAHVPHLLGFLPNPALAAAAGFLPPRSAMDLAPNESRCLKNQTNGGVCFCIDCVLTKSKSSLV